MKIKKPTLLQILYAICFLLIGVLVVHHWLYGPTINPEASEALRSVPAPNRRAVP